MKRVLFLLTAVLLLALFAVPSTPVKADSSLLAGCVSDPGSGPIGTVFVVTCFGFNPEEMFTAWATEPDGMVYSVQGGKVGKDGSVTYAFPTKYSDAAVSVGQWSLTLKGEGSGLTMIGRFTVTGGTTGVSGALLTGSSSGLVTGIGFMPFEPVSAWVEFPNGDCSSNWLYSLGLSTFGIGTFKADGKGTVQFTLPYSALLCGGTYHIVARGMTSGIGGETWLTTVNQNVTETATLAVTPSSAYLLGSRLVFDGAGFGAREPVTCWETTPQGAALPFGALTADASGSFTFGFTTGLDYGFVVVGEGAIGEWAMTCKGGVTGATGIARFTLTGHVVVDP